MKQSSWMLIEASLLMFETKNQDPEGNGSSITAKRDRRSPSPLDSQDTQTGIIMAGKKDAESKTIA